LLAQDVTSAGLWKYWVLAAIQSKALTVESRDIVRVELFLADYECLLFVEALFTCLARWLDHDLGV